MHIKLKVNERGIMELWQLFPGPNAGYVLELYDKYLQDPDAFDPPTRDFFDQIGPYLLSLDGGGNGSVAVQDAVQVPSAEVSASVTDIEKVMRVVNYAQSIREYGHLIANLDPLAGERPGDPELDPAFHGLTESDLARLPASIVGGIPGLMQGSALDSIRALREVYCSNIGYDYDHIRIPEERNWLRNAAESHRFGVRNMPIDPIQMLERLTEIETFEDFLQKTFPTKYRFSIEGLDTMVPILDEVIKGSAGMNMKNLLIGVAHRGRLNIMTHVLKRPVEQILAEFMDEVHPNPMEIKLGWTGDVKYHRGEFRQIDYRGGVLDIAIPPNPSHLEAVNPVAVGMARAAGTDVDQPGAPEFDPQASLTILIHGDAAFPGQGIVAETFNLSQLEGYWTGGTIHIIANNQLGFTTSPDQGRSTLYASDLAKGFKVPVVHVNADDPEACIEVARLASDYIAEFGKDFVIDLVGYRRYGHNELDEPRFTQPLMYEVINSHSTVRELWAQTLIQRGVLEEDQAVVIRQRYMNDLREIYDSLDKTDEFVDDAMPTEGELPPEGIAKRTVTRVTPDDLLAINQSLREITADVTLLKKLRNYLDDRRNSIESGENEIIWATAEEMAFATILGEGTAIRMTGQDVERGTFSQRHAVLTDLDTGVSTAPLQKLPTAQAAFEIYNSPLSEGSALGFEYGYSVQAPDRLVIWEAQYGDFVNSAQVVIDEYITSARAKWGQTPSLVMLLPHGYEGAGPDHSSARLERFLQLAAKTNIRIANPTLPAQYFHLLRRQATLLETDPLPLVVMTPKSLLRHPLVRSSRDDLTEGKWMPVLDDGRTLSASAEDITRLIVCSGKFYFDIVQDENREKMPHAAIIRLEQLYPFPVEDLMSVLKRYPNLEEIIWAQEEPKNMGAWEAMHWRISRLVRDRLPVYYVGRRRISSPAEGSPTLHRTNQKTIIYHAYTWKP